MAENNLPLHPSMRHPLTGEPLRALWVRPDGRAMWPIIGGAEDAAGEGDAGAGGQQQASGQQQHADATWDSLRSTWEESGLTPAQISGRLEASRKWEQRARNAPSPEELTALREKAERQAALEYEMASDKDRAVADATKAVQEQADATYRPLLAETAFRVAIGDRKPQDEVDEFIGDLNLTRFLTDDGRVDTAKVLARVEQFSPATGTQQNQQRRGPSPSGQGSSSGTQRSAPGMGSVGAGRDLYAETHTQKAG